MTFAYGPTSVQLHGIIMPYPLRVQRLNSVGLAADGIVKVRDEGVVESYIDIVIREDHDVIYQVRSFLKETVKLAKLPFTVTPDAGVDLGAGDGVALTVHYWSSDFMESMFAWHQYEYNLMLRRIYPA